MSDWVVVRDGGMWLVGRKVTPSFGSPVLSPVFDLHCQVRGAHVHYVARPMLLIPSLDRWQLSQSANKWPVKGLSAEKEIRKALRAAMARGAKGETK